MFVTEVGKLFKGQPLIVLAPGEKRTADGYIRFSRPPMNGFAFTGNASESFWMAGSAWQFSFKEFTDATGYVADLAAALAAQGA